MRFMYLKLYSLLCWSPVRSVQQANDIYKTGESEQCQQEKRKTNYGETESRARL